MSRTKFTTAFWVTPVYNMPKIIPKRNILLIPIRFLRASPFPCQPKGLPTQSLMALVQQPQQQPSPCNSRPPELQMMRVPCLQLQQPPPKTSGAPDFVLPDGHLDSGLGGPTNPIRSEVRSTTNIMQNAHLAHKEGHRWHLAMGLPETPYTPPCHLPQVHRALTVTRRIAANLPPLV